MDYDQDAPRQVLCDWITNSGGGVAAFDFPTKGILQEAVRYTQYDRLRDRNGRASGLLGWWPQKACTFIDNHDTGERCNIKTHDGVMQVNSLHGCLSVSWQTEVLRCAGCARTWCNRRYCLLWRIVTHIDDICQSKCNLAQELSRSRLQALGNPFFDMLDLATNAV